MNLVALAGGVGGAKLAHGLTLCHSEPQHGEESRPTGAEIPHFVRNDTGAGLFPELPPLLFLATKYVLESPAG